MVVHRLLVQRRQQTLAAAVAVEAAVTVQAAQAVQVMHELLIGVNYGTTLRIFKRQSS
jgi:hypothetical protein